MDRATWSGCTALLLWALLALLSRAAATVPPFQLAAMAHANFTTDAVRGYSCAMGAALTWALYHGKQPSPVPELHSMCSPNPLLWAEPGMKLMTKRATAFENFLYLLSEMERAVDGGKIRWPARQMRRVQTRLARIARKVAQASERTGRNAQGE